MDFIKIDLNDKKKFITYFLNHFQCKRRESVWILDYIKNHDKCLENIHFVDDVIGLSRSITISTHCVDSIPFKFIKNELGTNDAEKAFHDIRLNPEETLYIQLNFNRRNRSIEYASVLEENPNMVKKITEEFSSDVDIILNSSLIKSKINVLMEQIDVCLEKGQKRKFKTLSKQYKELKNELENLNL